MIETSPLRLWALTRYGQQGASSRMRLLQYLPALAAAGCSARVEPLLDDDYVAALYARRSNRLAILRGYARRLWRCISPAFRAADCIWVEKELWPWAPAWFERLLLAGRPWVLDLDDAIFHNYDLHRRSWIRRLYGRKIDRLMAAATVVTAGNPYLAARAVKAGARDVRVVPTAVDLSRYSSSARTAGPDSADKRIVVGWIGSPATVQYLQVIAPALQAAASTLPLTLRVIGAPAPRIEGVETESIPWTEASEVGQIAQFQIGVMPLPDSPWERGKCGYKLIQYMACGLPVIASPVGVNAELVTPGVCGELAADPAQWISALLALANDRPRREAYGLAGRARVEQRYCTAVTSLAVVASIFDARHNRAAANARGSFSSKVNQEQK